MTKKPASAFREFLLFVNMQLVFVIDFASCWALASLSPRPCLFSSFPFMEMKSDCLAALG